MTTTLTNLKQNIDYYRYNPSMIQTAILRMVREVYDGKLDIVDASNPFVYLTEAVATVGASNMTDSATNNRKQYAKAAQTMEDLYRHMRYGELDDAWAQPSSAPFIIGFNKEELIKRMVSVPGTDIRKIVIPRNTTISIADNTFSLQYPIELRQMSHGGLSVVYDVEKPSPLRNIETNVIDWKPLTAQDGSEMIFFPVQLDQFKIASYNNVVNAMQKFSLQATISDQFYYCRVWREINGGWEEIETTYSQDIYDVSKVTAIVKVIDNTVSVDIPIVYIKKGMISGKVRMDVYQTKGPLSLDLSSFDQKQFIVNWLAIDKAEQDAYVAPLKAMSSTQVYSLSTTSGGQDAMTFEALKARNLQNAFGPKVLPITPAQAQNKLERKGYNIVKNLDYVTNRVFAATRAMPGPKDTDLITPANAGIHTLKDTLESLSHLSTAYLNNESLTLSPKTLFRVEKGVLKVCSDAEVDLLNSMPGDKKALAITENGYFYTPFHYVFDTDNTTFSSRAYYLDSPKVRSRSFIAENDTTLLQVATDSALIQRTPSGWQIIVTTRSSQEWKELDDAEVFVNIGFQPDRTGDYAYIRGEFIGRTNSNERVFRFDITTNYDINASNAVEITNAMMYEESQQYLRTSLSQNFDIFYATSHVMPSSWTPASFDPLIGLFLLPFGSSGISRERLDVHLGTALTNLWTRGRTVAGEEDYARWDHDVPATYASDVYETDPTTGVAFKIVDGELVYTKLHSAGDPIIRDGEPVYRYRKGDVKRDSSGVPILINGRKLTRQVDLFLLEAPYYFATNKAAVDYRQQLVDTIVGWISEDLKDISKMLLDKTSIFFYPVQNVSSVDVVYGPGLKTTIDAGQYFNLRLYVRDAVYKNAELRASITRSTVVALSECLKHKTVSESQITEALKEIYGDDVIAFEVEGLGGATPLTLCTMVDDAARLTLRKRLEYRADQTFALREDVNVDFIPHERVGVSIGS